MALSLSFFVTFILLYKVPQCSFCLSFSVTFFLIHEGPQRLLPCVVSRFLESMFLSSFLGPFLGSFCLVIWLSLLWLVLCCVFRFSSAFPALLFVSLSCFAVTYVVWIFFLCPLSCSVSIFTVISVSAFFCNLARILDLFPGRFLIAGSVCKTEDLQNGHFFQNLFVTDREKIGFFDHF